MFRVRLYRFGLPIVPVVVLASVVITFVIISAAGASPKYTWSDIAYAPTVSNGATITSSQYSQVLHNSIGLTGGIPCNKQTVNFGPGVTDASDCWYDTSIGLISNGGNAIKLKGQTYAGYIDNGNSQLLPTPNPGIFIQLVSNDDYSAYYVYFRTVETTKMNLTYPDAPLYNFIASTSHQHTS